VIAATGLLFGVAAGPAGSRGFKARARAAPGGPDITRPSYLLGTWDTVAVTADGTRYPQTWKITKEDFRYNRDGGGWFSGTDDGFKLTGRATRTGLGKNTLISTSVAGDYTSTGNATLTKDTQNHSSFWAGTTLMAGTFEDSNGTKGTFTGTLVDPRPERPPTSGKITVHFGGRSGKDFDPYEYYVTRGTLLRVCNDANISTSPYTEAFPLAISMFKTAPGECTKYVSVGNTTGLALIFDGDHPQAMAYVDIAP
jgi:hypothetical protein